MTYNLLTCTKLFISKIYIVGSKAENLSWHDFMAEQFNIIFLETMQIIWILIHRILNCYEVYCYLSHLDEVFFMITLIYSFDSYSNFVVQQAVTADYRNLNYCTIASFSTPYTYHVTEISV